MKVQCTDYVLSEDQFVFTVSATDNDSAAVEQRQVTGEQIADLADRKLVSCDDFEIAVFLLYRKHFVEEPSDMLSKSITI